MSAPFASARSSKRIAPSRSIADHKEIVAALEARDTERAERLVREHTLKLRDHVERFVDID